MRCFGTDGVRGGVGQAPMTVDFALRLASAAARVLAPTGGRVLIGKDTRLSGYPFESALGGGFFCPRARAVGITASAHARRRSDNPPPRAAVLALLSQAGRCC